MYYGRKKVMEQGGMMSQGGPSLTEAAVAAYWERLKDEYGIPSTEGYDFEDFMAVAAGKAPKPSWWDSSYAMDAVIEMKGALESLGKLATSEHKGAVAFDSLGSEVTVLDEIYGNVMKDDQDFQRVAPIYIEARRLVAEQ